MKIISARITQFFFFFNFFYIVYVFHQYWRHARQYLVPLQKLWSALLQAEIASTGPKTPRKELSKPKVQEKSPYIVHRWIENRILPHLDPRMSSLCLLEAKVTQKQACCKGCRSRLFPMQLHQKGKSTPLLKWP